MATYQERNRSSFMETYINFFKPRSQYVLARRDNNSNRQIDGNYEEKISYCPPPLVIIIISIIQIVCFLIDLFTTTEALIFGEGKSSKILKYDHLKRDEIWRFVTYSCCHASLNHLFYNVVLQLVLGIYLELVHPFWSILVLYFSGIIGGSLINALIDPETDLIGASGGVYALYAVQFVIVLLNWNDLEYPRIQLLSIIFILLVDFISTFLDRSMFGSIIGYGAHLGGALFGITIGLCVLKIITLKKWKTCIKWTGLVLFIFLFLATVLLNIFYLDNKK